MSDALSNVIRRAPRSGVTGRLTHNQMPSGGYQPRGGLDSGLRSALELASRRRMDRFEKVSRNRRDPMPFIEEIDEEMHDEL